MAAGGAAGYSSRSGEVDSLQRELSDSDSRAEALAEDLVRAADDIDDLEDDLDDSLEDNLALRDTINTCQKALKVQLNNVVQALKASDSYLSLYYLGQIRVNNPQTKVCLQFARGVAGNATEG